MNDRIALSRTPASAASLVGSVEAGGTKFVCGVGDGPTGSRMTTRIATRQPDETLAEVIAFFGDAERRLGPIAAFGVGSFGPVDLDPASGRHGEILATPKPGWRGVNIASILAKAFDVPVALDSDVNAAALAEARARGAIDEVVAYITVGTGIGVGLAPPAGRTIPQAELGHLIVRRHPGHEDFPGACPFHGDCAEGLASGPAFKAYWGEIPLPSGHPAWAIQAWYVAQICAAVVYAYKPHRIVLGGGMSQPFLVDPVRDHAARLLGTYVEGYDTLAAVAARIIPPASHEPSGLMGGYWLAERALASPDAMWHQSVASTQDRAP